MSIPHKGRFYEHVTPNSIPNPIHMTHHMPTFKKALQDFFWQVLNGSKYTLDLLVV